MLCRDREKERGGIRGEESLTRESERERERKKERQSEERVTQSETTVGN